MIYKHSVEQLNRHEVARGLATEEDDTARLIRTKLQLERRVQSPNGLQKAYKIISGIIYEYIISIPPIIVFGSRIAFSKSIIPLFDLVRKIYF